MRADSQRKAYASAERKTFKHAMRRLERAKRALWLTIVRDLKGLCKNRSERP